MSSSVLPALRILFAVEALAFLVLRATSADAWPTTSDEPLRIALAEWVPVYLLLYLAFALRRREPDVFWLLAGTQLLLVLHGAQSALVLPPEGARPYDVVLSVVVAPLHLGLFAAALARPFRMRFLVGLDPDLALVHAQGRVPIAALRLHRALGDREARATLARLHGLGGFVGAIDQERAEVVSAAALAAERGARCPGCASVMTVGDDRCGACDRSLLVGETRRPLPAPVAVRVAAVVTAAIAGHHLAAALLRMGEISLGAVAFGLPTRGAPDAVPVVSLLAPRLVFPAAMLVAGVVLGLVALGLARRRRWAHPTFMTLAAIAVLIDSTRIGADFYAAWDGFDFHPPASVVMSMLFVDLAWLALKIAGLVLLLRPAPRAYLRRSLAGWARAELDRHGEIPIEALAARLRLPPHRAAAVALDLAASTELDEAVLDFRRGALVELDRMSEDDEERHCTECGAPLAHLAVGRSCGWCGAGELSVHATYRS